jgi:hypothetical protein
MQMKKHAREPMIKYLAKIAGVFSEPTNSVVDTGCVHLGGFLNNS